MKVLLLGNEIASHTNFGGYVHIKDCPEADFLDIASVCPLFWKWGKPLKFFNYILAVRKACKMSKNYDIVHSIYEDNYYFPLFFKCRCKSVGTVHLDILGLYNPLRKFLLNKVLKKLDVIIVLSSEQKKVMEKLGYKCAFIPHGFSSPRFSVADLSALPTPFEESKINIFFSGNTYRDLDTLENVIAKSHARNDMIFHVLSQKGKNKERFFKYKNVVTYDRVDDNVYFTLLSKCDYNFLPLTFATANNTLLEAQFLGRISILPKIGGIMDYASSANVFYSSEAELLWIFSHLRKSGESETILKDAQKYNWENIYIQLTNVYKQLASES